MAYKPENLLWLTRTQDLFTNAFPLDGKIELSLTGVSKNGRKKMIPLAKKLITTSRNKVIFNNWISTSRKKSLNKRILFQLDRKSVSTSRNGDFV